MSEIKRIVDAYRSTVVALNNYRTEHFPEGTQVLVEHRRYTGPGVVVSGDARDESLVWVLNMYGLVMDLPIESLTERGPKEPEGAAMKLLHP